jgi:hypothetical protein
MFTSHNGSNSFEHLTSNFVYFNYNFEDIQKNFQFCFSIKICLFVSIWMFSMSLIFIILYVRCFSFVLVRKDIDVNEYAGLSNIKLRHILK